MSKPVLEFYKQEEQCYVCMMPEPSGDCWDGRDSWVSILIQVFLPLKAETGFGSEDLIVPW